MIPVSEALRIIVEQAPPLAAERVALDEAMGRVLAEEVLADTDLPPFDRAQMDGYAVRSADVRAVPARLRVIGEAAAGRGWRGTLQTGEAVRIMTGAPLPEGADGVQQVELTRELEGGAFVEIERATTPGQFFVPRASEIRKGVTVFKAGEEINAAGMAVLASFGYAEVAVRRRPRVAVLATGSELVPAAEQPGADQIRDSNSYSLAAYAALAGALVERMRFADDDPELLQRLIAEAAERADVVVLSGGVSMGVYDFTKTALRALDAEIFFERVSLEAGQADRLRAARGRAARACLRSTGQSRLRQRHLQPVRAHGAARDAGRGATRARRRARRARARGERLGGESELFARDTAYRCGGTPRRRTAEVGRLVRLRRLRAGDRAADRAGGSAEG